MEQRRRGGSSIGIFVDGGGVSDVGSKGAAESDGNQNSDYDCKGV